MFPDAQSPRPMMPESRPVPGPPVPGPPARTPVPGPPPSTPPNPSDNPAPSTSQATPYNQGPVGADGSVAVARVTEAVAGLDGLDDVAVGEHVARFDAVHAALTSALSSIDRV